MALSRPSRQTLAGISPLELLAPMTCICIGVKVDSFPNVAAEKTWLISFSSTRSGSGTLLFS